MPVTASRREIFIGPLTRSTQCPGNLISTPYSGVFRGDGVAPYFESAAIAMQLMVYQ